MKYPRFERPPDYGPGSCMQEAEEDADDTDLYNTQLSTALLIMRASERVCMYKVQNH